MLSSVVRRESIKPMYNHNGMQKHSPDLRGLCDHPQCKRYDVPDDCQRIAIKRKGDKFFLLHHHGIEGFKEIIESKSLHYSSHSTTLGIAGPSLLQLSLALCLMLYPVSYAIQHHREIAGRYLLSLPQGDFVKDIILPL